MNMAMTSGTGKPWAAVCYVAVVDGRQALCLLREDRIECRLYISNAKDLFSVVRALEFIVYITSDKQRGLLQRTVHLIFTVEYALLLSYELTGSAALLYWKDA